MTDNTETELAALVRYFRDCLLADGGERELEDAFSTGEASHHLVRSGPQDEAFAPVWLNWTEKRELLHAASMQRQERELQLGWRFICGMHPERGERRLRTPVFLASVQMSSTKGGYHAEPLPGSLRINPVALVALGLPRDYITEVDENDPRFGEFIARLDALPELALKEHANRLPALRSPALRRVEARLLWLTQRSRVAASTAYELETLAASASFSPCLREILGHPQDTPAAPPSTTPDSIPTRLSAAQKQALINATAHTLSVVYGAPGTGKTYTIGGITADRVINGERVLIVCGNEHAADVVFTKLAEAFAYGEDSHLVVRAGQGEYRQRLLRDLDALLSTAQPASPNPPAIRSQETSGEVSPAVVRARQMLAHSALAQQFLAGRFAEALALAHAGGEVLRDRRRSPIAALRRQLTRFKLRKSPPLSKHWTTFQNQASSHQASARRFLHLSTQTARDALLRSSRHKLAALSVALRSRNSGYRVDRMAAMDWATLTRAFPVWVASAQSLDRALPLENGLFDLVVIDEATQCNLALALPALQRARRAVIVGDPRQLRHFSFLARRRQEQFAAEHGVEGQGISLDYRDQSLIDYAMQALRSADAQVWLDEHFRSHPDLIEFNNRRFYEGRLKVLTGMRRLTNSLPRQVVECPLQLNDGVNQGEVDCVIEHLRQLIEQENDLPDEDASKVGVVAMFSTLAQILQARIQAAFRLETLARHNLLVATPYGFQGEERDVILLATGVHAQLSRTARQYMERPDVFNVATTRARDRQIIFIGQGSAPQAQDGLLGAYLAFAPERPVPAQPFARGAGSTRDELIVALQEKGYRCWPDFTLGGSIIDLLVVAGQSSLAIDLVGVAEPIGQPWACERYTLLERTGLNILPVAFHEWLWQPQEIIQRIEQVLGDHQASPADSRQSTTASLRWHFEKHGRNELSLLVEQMEQTRGVAESWLGRRFSTTEVTYQRYMHSIQELVDDTVRILDQLRLLLDESRALKLDSSLIDERAAQASNAVRRALQALDSLATRLALDEGWGPDAQSASLADLERLTDRLSQYQSASSR